MTTRLDSFEGPDVEYIRYLEGIVLSLRNRLGDEAPRNRQADLETLEFEQPQASSKDIDHSISRAQATGDSSIASAFKRNVRPQTARKHRKRATFESLEFIPYHPRHAPAKSNPVPRWIRPAQELIRETPVATKWISRLHEMGLYEAMEDDHALAYLLDTAVTPDMTIKEKQPSNDTLDHVRQYALAAAMRGVKASVALKLANFQKFLVLSACAVLLHEGYDEIQVLDAAKLCIGTEIDNGYCKRLVQSSKFVNRLVDNLNIRGWGNRASELLILWNRAPSWYFSLASYANASLQYLTDELSTDDLTNPRAIAVDSTRWTALFIPGMLCHILRNKFSVEGICQILGYQKADLLRVRKNTWKLQRSQAYVQG